MSDWNGGYVTDIAYTAGFYRETTPGWIAAAALLLGQRPPDLTGRLRVAELGCGNGFTAAVTAAAYPAADVWGFDFNPAHIANAQRLSENAGLGNLRYEETSFAHLAAAAPGAYPLFDIIVLHGVWAWIAPEVQAQIVAFIGSFLAPGGFVYVSYNVATGWAALAPVQTAMRLLASRSGRRSDEAVAEVVGFVERLRASDAAYFRNNPTVARQIEALGLLDRRYFAHEFLCAHWQPAMMAQVAAAMAEAKCIYVGNATLSDNVMHASVPPALQPLLAELQDPILVETIRDLAAAQSFRRDLYRRGSVELAAPELLGLMEDFALIGVAAKPRGELRFACLLGEATGHADVYDPLFEMLAAGPLTVDAARRLPVFESKPIGEVLQAFALLISSGYAHPLLPRPGGGEGAAALNGEIARCNAAGDATEYLIAPAIGSAISSNVVETLVVGELLSGGACDPEQLARTVADLLARTGRSPQRDGQPINEPAEARQAVRDAIADILQTRLPQLRALGVVAA